MHYSVPYQYIKQKVQVKCTANTVESYQGDIRIASHHRLWGRKGQYSTIESHMPPDHQEYLTWDEKRFLAWAKTNRTGNTRGHPRHPGCLQDQAASLQILYGHFETR